VVSMVGIAWVVCVVTVVCILVVAVEILISSVVVGAVSRQRKQLEAVSSVKQYNIYMN